MKRFFIIFLLFFCYISLTATKACQEDYVIFKSSPTATPTPEEGDDTPTPTPTGTITITVTVTTTTTTTPTPTPTWDDDDIDDEDDFDDIDDLDEESSASGIRVNELLNDLASLSNDEPTNWLGEAFTDENSGREEEVIKFFIDSDNDGYSDDIELENETDPNSNASFPYIAKTRLFDRVNQKDINERI